LYTHHTTVFGFVSRVVSPWAIRGLCPTVLAPSQWLLTICRSVKTTCRLAINSSEKGISTILSYLQFSIFLSLWSSQKIN